MCWKKALYLTFSRKNKLTMKQWTTVIRPKTGWFDINLKELFHYKDLIKQFVSREYTTLYKQTILGPLWFIVNPIITTVIFTVVFGNIAKIPTDGIPPFLFYMAGNILWTYFATCLSSTAGTFTKNAAMFGKVYFPRLTVTIATVIFNLITFSIQLVLFIIILLFFMWKGSPVQPNLLILLTPLLVFQVALMGLGFGIIISSLTTKYRDLSVLIVFGVNLWMYATPIIYPLSQVSLKMRLLILINPMTPVIETFRYAYLGSGVLVFKYLAISSLITICVLIIGVVLFSKVEKTFIDTV